MTCAAQTPYKFPSLRDLTAEFDGPVNSRRAAAPAAAVGSATKRGGAASGLSLDESKLLTKGIKETKTLGELSDILDTAGDVMNQIHVSAALIHAAQLHAAGRIPVDQHADLTGFLDAWSDVAESHVASFDERGLANIAYALGKLPVRSQTGLAALLVAQSQGKLARFEPQHLSNVIWGLAALGEAPPPEWLSLFFTVSAPKLAAFSPQGLANTIYALGRMGWQPDTTWAMAWSAAATAQAALFKPQELSNALYGLARCGYSHA